MAIDILVVEDEYTRKRFPKGDLPKQMAYAIIVPDIWQSSLLYTRKEILP